MIYILGSLNTLKDNFKTYDNFTQQVKIYKLLKVLIKRLKTFLDQKVDTFGLRPKTSLDSKLLYNRIYYFTKEFTVHLSQYFF